MIHDIIHPTHISLLVSVTYILLVKGLTDKGSNVQPQKADMLFYHFARTCQIFNTSFAYESSLRRLYPFLEEIFVT